MFARGTDKNCLTIQPKETILPGERYLLGRNPPTDSMVIRESSNITEGTKDGLDFRVLKSVNRFLIFLDFFV